MSLDRSLKAKNALRRHRNVLTRAERIEQLVEDDRFEPDASVFGLPKVAHRKVTSGGKKKDIPEGKDAAASAEGAAKPEAAPAGASKS